MSMKQLPLLPFSKAYSRDATWEQTAASLGNEGVNVISTPHLIGEIEFACTYNVMPFYDEDDATVGTHVCVDHLGAAVPGTPIEIEAILEEVDRRRLQFSATITQNGKVIMKGRHDRFIVSKAKFKAMSKAPA
jgi:predicted thioesterase